MSQVQAAIAAGVYRREDFRSGPGAGSRTTFSAYADEWLKTIVVEKSTLRSYRTALAATWKPAMGEKLLTQARTFMKDHGYVFENPNTGRPWQGVADRHRPGGMRANNRAENSHLPIRRR
jgi:hypothetical protein